MKTYGVVRDRDGWAIIATGRRRGRFNFKVDAEEAAVRLAQRAVADGVTAEVLVQGIGGEMAPLKVA